MNGVWTVGIDGSPESIAALRWTASLARDTGARVEPLLAWEVPLPIWATSGRRSIEFDHAGLGAEAAVVADRCVNECADLIDVIDEPVVVEGHPSRVLLEWSESGRRIVVGRRGVGALRHRLLGSTSNYLATHAVGPVIVVPERADPPADHVRRILVGVDGSDHSVAALEWAMHAAPSEAVIEAVCAVDVVPWLSPELVYERHRDEVDAATGRVTAAVDRVDPGETVVRSIALHGPQQALSERFSDADLVVVGPRGRGAIARTVLGSITMWLLNESPCPVAVVPSGWHTR
ncbi:MAG: universal stress protein [Actinomycetota bacterium]